MRFRQFGRGSRREDAGGSDEPTAGSTREESGPSPGAGRPGAGGRTPEFESEALSYINTLYSTALRLTANPDAAEDLVQETYLKAFRAAGQFEPGTNLKAWLFTILHNTFLNTRRHVGRETAVEDAEDFDRAGRQDAADSPEQILLRKTLDKDLQAALDSLPDVFREAVWLRDVEEFTYAEIADIVHVPIGTVMSRISRGRRMLYNYLTGKVEVAGRP